MKTIYLSTLFVTLFSLAYSQKLVVNKVDEFTGRHVKQTSQQLLCMKGLFESIAVSIRKVDSVSLVDVQINRSDLFSIHEDAKLILLMADKSTYELIALDYEISDRVDLGSFDTYVIRMTYANVLDPNLKNLENSAIEKVRIYYSGGYVDYEVKEKNSLNLANCVKLVAR